MATGVLSVSDQLLRLHNGTSSTNKHTFQFRTMAATSGWNEAALLSVYRQGLDSGIGAQMAIYGDSVGLESFMQKANRIFGFWVSELISLPHLRSRSPVCLTRHRSPSTRAYAS